MSLLEWQQLLKASRPLSVCRPLAYTSCNRQRPHGSIETMGCTTLQMRSTHPFGSAEFRPCTHYEVFSDSRGGDVYDKVGMCLEEQPVSNTSSGYVDKLTSIRTLDMRPRLYIRVIACISWRILLQIIFRITRRVYHSRLQSLCV